MASALEAIAEFIALTISTALLVAEPVHCVVQPVSAAASCIPYCSGVLNGLVVTWLTNTMRQLGCDGAALAARALPALPRAASAEPKAAPLSMKRRSGICMFVLDGFLIVASL